MAWALRVCCLMFLGGFWAGRDAEGAREAIFGGFGAGRDAEGAREAIFPARSAGFVLRA